MVGTTLLFSQAFIEGVRAFGFIVTPDEADDFMHLWRYNGWVIGVEPELLPVNEARAGQLADLIATTQGEPDEDARSLVHAFVESPRVTAGQDQDAQRQAERHVALGYGFTRSLLGDAMADALQVPRTSARFVLPGIRAVLGRMERVGRRVPGYDARLIRAGHGYWRQAIELGLAGRAARFMPPTRLEGLR